MKLVHVPGRNNRHQVTLFALSTCGWCKKTKQFLDNAGVEYDYIYVDQCEGDERREASDAVRELNPRGSYPTVRIDSEVVAGFDEERLSELLQT